MTTIRVASAPLDLREEAKAFLTSVALTAGFTILYVALAPVVLLGAVLGALDLHVAGPKWAVVLLAKERVATP